MISRVFPPSSDYDITRDGNLKSEYYVWIFHEYKQFTQRKHKLCYLFFFPDTPVYGAGYREQEKKFSVKKIF